MRETFGLMQRQGRVNMGGTACFKLCAQHRKPGVDAQSPINAHLGSRANSKFPMPSAHSLKQAVPPALSGDPRPSIRPLEFAQSS